MLSRRASLVAFIAPFATTACVVGPNFKAPAPPPVSSYTQEAQAQTTTATPGVPGGQAQHLIPGADIPAEWWTMFHSRRLNDLIEQALAHNADLKAAQAAILVAHPADQFGVKAALIALLAWCFGPVLSHVQAALAYRALTSDRAVQAAEAGDPP